MNTVPTLTLSPSGGDFNSGTTLGVTISDTLSGCSISYTMDGTTPTPTHGTVVAVSTVKVGLVVPVLANKTIVLKAMAFKAGHANSAVVSGRYNFSSPL